MEERAAVTVAAFTNVYPPILGGVGTSLRAFKTHLTAFDVDVRVVGPGSADLVLASAGRVVGGQFPVAREVGPGQLLAIARWHPRVVWLHHFAGIAAAGLRYARLAGLPLVYHWHTRYQAHAGYAKVQPAWMVAAAVRVANACNAVVVPSRPMEREVQDFGVKRPVLVVPTPIVVTPGHAAKRHDRTWMYAGRLSVEKNVGWLAEVARRRPDWHGIVLGDGPERRRLEGLRNVTLLGSVPQAEVTRRMAEARVLLFPSGSETQGLVTGEALAVGCPVLAVRDPVNEEAGAWPVDDAAAMAGALDDLPSPEDALRRARCRGPEFTLPPLATLLHALATTRTRPRKGWAPRDVAGMMFSVLPDDSEDRCAWGHVAALLDTIL